MLKKFLFMLFFLLLTALLSAETIKADYSVSYGLFGKIGTAKALLLKEEKKYSITIVLESTGLAKILSKDRKEKHISTGHIENGLLISDSYQVHRSYGSKEMTKSYMIDHQKKQVIKRYVKKEHGKTVSDEKQILPYYAKDDLLTLYFNLDRLIPDKTVAKSYLFQAVGAEKQSGKVKVTIPEKSALQIYKNSLGGDAAWYATAIIYQKIFQSEEGRLMLAVGKNGIIKKAVLKDVVFFGDIVAELQ
jgi:hypothetical protein